jgi:hypothetical protein
MMNAESLRHVLKDASDDLPMNFYAGSVMFGYDRVVPGLSYQRTLVQPDEIEKEVQAYQTYVDSFSRENAMKRPIAYSIFPNGGNFDFTNLDRWYERDAGERLGAYTLYRLKLRD